MSQSELAADFVKEPRNTNNPGLGGSGNKQKKEQKNRKKSLYDIDKKGRFGGSYNQPGGFARAYQRKGGSKMKLMAMVATMMGGICVLQMLTQSNYDKAQTAKRAATEADSSHKTGP